MKDLEELLEEIEGRCAEGNRRSLVPALQEMMRNRKEYYRHSLERGMEDRYGDCLFKALLLELDEEEEDSIEAAELAYLSLGCRLKDSLSARPDHYRSRLLLLHCFSDYLTDAVISLFLEKYRKDQAIMARNIALECLEKMQLADMYYLEENAPEMLDSDELTDACNSIGAGPVLSGDERKEAELMHKVLYAYLKAKYKN